MSDGLLAIEDNWLAGGEYCINAAAPGRESYTLVFDAALIQTAIGNVDEE